MAIVFAEDFQGYGTGTNYMLDGLYSQIGGGYGGSSLVQDPDPNNPNYHVFFCNNGIDAATQVGFRRPLPAPVTTIGVAQRIWLPQLPQGNEREWLITLADGSNRTQVTVTVTSTGVLQFLVAEGHDAAVLAQSPGPVITTNSWQHLEIKVVGGINGGGSVEARVNGATVIPATACTTFQAGNDATFAQLRNATIGDYGPHYTGAFYLKDWVVWNTDGAHNNDFLGTVSVVSMWPDADVSLNWTPSTGASGYNLINQAPPTDNVDYISAPFPAPAPAQFSLSDLPVTVSSVKALISQVRARKSDGGDGKLQNALISGGAEIDGKNRPITTAFTYYEDVFEVDPATGNGWTPASADNAILKLNRTV